MQKVNPQYELYNNTYKKFTPSLITPDNLKVIESYLDENNQSLYAFMKSYFNQFGSMHDLNGKRVLELGCGLGGLSHTLSKYTDNLHALDISSLAISIAKDIANMKNIEIDFTEADITQNPNLDQKFDYIFDSHLFHCLTSDKDRQTYLNFVRNHLNKNGVFLLETMVFNKDIQEPIEFELDANYILKQKIEKNYFPIRTIKPAIEIEKEIKNSGMKINYFYCHNELSFNIFPKYADYPTFRLPTTLRLSTTLG